MTGASVQGDALVRWLAMLAGGEPAGGLLEVRHRPRGEHLRRLGFFGIDDHPATARAIFDVASDGDVWCGVAPRRAVYRLRDRRQSGGTDAIARVWSLWIDADSLGACEALRSFAPAPACVIRSGGGLHAYWPLREPLAPAHAKRANQRLAHRLGSDRVAVDAARVLRPPATANWKYDEPRRVTVARFTPATFTAREVVAQLEDPPRPVAARPLRALRSDGPPPLEGLTATVRSAQQGNRNATLYWSGCRAAEHITEGRLDSGAAWEALRAAALQAGLGEHEVSATLASAFGTRALAA